MKKYKKHSIREIGNDPSNFCQRAAILDPFWPRRDAARPTADLMRLVGKWRYRVESLASAGWLSKHPKKFARFLNCPPAGVYLKSFGLRCATFFCPFCWARGKVGRPFDFLEARLGAIKGVALGVRLASHVTAPSSDYLPVFYSASSARSFARGAMNERIAMFGDHEATAGVVLTRAFPAPLKDRTGIAVDVVSVMLVPEPGAETTLKELQRTVAELFAYPAGLMKEDVAASLELAAAFRRVRTLVCWPVGVPNTEEASVDDLGAIPESLSAGRLKPRKAPEFGAIDDCD